MTLLVEYYADDSCGNVTDEPNDACPKSGRGIDRWERPCAACDSANASYQLACRTYECQMPSIEAARIYAAALSAACPNATIGIFEFDAPSGEEDDVIETYSCGLNTMRYEAGGAVSHGPLSAPPA